MDFAAEDRCRDWAYNVWRQLSIEPPVGSVDVLADPSDAGTSSRLWRAATDTGVHAAGIEQSPGRAHV